MNLQVWWINYVCEHWESYEKEQPWYEDNAWVKASEAEALVNKMKRCHNCKHCIYPDYSYDTSCNLTKKRDDCIGHNYKLWELEE